MVNPFQEVSGYDRELLTLDAKEKMKDDVEKIGHFGKTCRQQYNNYIC